MKSHLIGEKNAWEGFRLGRTFTDQRMLGDVKKTLQRKTGGEGP